MRALLGAIAAVLLAILFTTLSVLSFFRPKLDLTTDLEQSVLDNAEFLGNQLSFYSADYVTTPGAYEMTIFPDHDLKTLKGLWYSNVCSATILRENGETTSEGKSEIERKTWWFSLSLHVKNANPRFLTTLSFYESDIGRPITLTADMTVNYPNNSSVNEFGEYYEEAKATCNVHVVSEDDYAKLETYYRMQEIRGLRLYIIVGALFFDFMAIGVFVNRRKILDEI